MVSINESREVNASSERIWDIISDMYKDPGYWRGLDSVRDTRREGDVIEREVKVGLPGQKGQQTIRLHPKQSVEMTMTRGPMKGSREIKLSPLGDDKKTGVNISWNFQPSGVPAFARSFIIAQIEEGTKETPGRIATAGEGENRFPTNPFDENGGAD